MGPSRARMLARRTVNGVTAMPRSRGQRDIQPPREEFRAEVFAAPRFLRDDDAEDEGMV